MLSPGKEEATNVTTQLEDEYKERILHTARELFKEHGVEAVNMHQIAKATGIGQGTMYRRYAHKGELCSDLLGSSSNRFLSELEAASQLHLQPGQSPLKGLESMIGQLVDYIDDNAVLLAAVIPNSSCKPRHLTRFQHPLFQRLHAIISGLLKQAAANGEIEDIDPFFTANTMIAAVSPELYMYQLGHIRKEEIAAGLRRIFIVGLRKAPIHG
jgi:AcrR family transcriptional regulator